MDPTFRSGHKLGVGRVRGRALLGGGRGDGARGRRGAHRRAVPRRAAHRRLRQKVQEEDISSGRYYLVWRHVFRWRFRHFYHLSIFSMALCEIIP